MEFALLDFIFCIIVVVCSLIWPYIYCQFASFITERISRVDDSIYGSNWYNYPVGVQKYLILIIALSERPIYFTGFGLMKCTLEMFGAVRLFLLTKFKIQNSILYFLMIFRFLLFQITKSSFSFYVIFRQL